MLRYKFYPVNRPNYCIFEFDSSRWLDAQQLADYLHNLHGYSWLVELTDEPMEYITKWFLPNQEPIKFVFHISQ